jgi:hypothetical protein
MSTPIDYSKANLSTLGKMFGMDRKTVKNRIEKAVLKPADKVKGKPVYLVSEVAQIIYGVVPSDDDDEVFIDPEKLHPGDAKDYWMAKLKRLEFFAAEKTYSSQQDVRDEFSSLASRLKETIQSFPDKAETELAATPKEIVRLILLCDSLQAQLYSEYLD